MANRHTVEFFWVSHSGDGRFSHIGEKRKTDLCEVVFQPYKPKGPGVWGGVPKIFRGGVVFCIPVGGPQKSGGGGGLGGECKPKKNFGCLRRPKMPDFAAEGGKIWLGVGGGGWVCST